MLLRTICCGCVFGYGQLLTRPPPHQVLRDMAVPVPFCFFSELGVMFTVSRVTSKAPIDCGSSRRRREPQQWFSTSCICRVRVLVRRRAGRCYRPGYATKYTATIATPDEPLELPTASYHHRDRDHVSMPPILNWTRPSPLRCSANPRCFH